MKELSLHILDIVGNSLKAKASQVLIDISDSKAKDQLTITIRDDGVGMSKELVERVVDPFTTSRTTRKVGLGIPLFKQAAEQASGFLQIDSVLHQGTTVTAQFSKSSIDCPPLGEMGSTISTLIQGSPQVHFIYHYQSDRGEFSLDTEEIGEIMEGIPLNEPQVLNWISEFIDSNQQQISE